MFTTVEAEATVGGIVNDGTLNTAQVQTFKKGFCSVRHGLALIVHLCNFSISTQQMNMSIALPAMVNNTAPPSPPSISTERPPTDFQDNWNETLNEFKAVAAMYDWSPEIQGIILSSLNYGSFLAPIPSGYLAEIFGTKYLAGAGMFITSVLTLFTPLAADTGVTLLIVLQIIQGIVQVMLLTSQYSIWARWAPPTERSQLITIAVSGSVLGSFIILLVGGHLCQTIGWPYVFYIFGGIGCICSFLWFALIYDDPVNHPFISTSEKEYIICSLAQEDSPPGWSLPIKAMIKSLPLWSILVFYFSDYWHYFVIRSYLPTYISSVLQANIRDSGMLSALPFVSACICIVPGGLLADFLLSRKILRLNTIRKLFTAIGVLLPCAFFVSLFWVRSSFSATMAFLILSSATKSLSQSGALVNFMDIAPRYSALLRGLSQIFSYIAGAISPTVAGFFISQDSEFGWRNVFLLSAAVNIAGLFFYLIFGQAEVQDWAKGRCAPASEQTE
ncbi:probable small intestine urate exporter [Eubalaena glacialis]|uniref:probable small intestine urate exporter n=1 Tax=Eubalaena glacialis TaxID=27606 RepID=UPI002A59A9FC|nr:probable small intestine urate exporter [Eubalaena glacialis]